MSEQINKINLAETLALIEARDSIQALIEQNPAYKIAKLALDNTSTLKELSNSAEKLGVAISVIYELTS